MTTRQFVIFLALFSTATCQLSFHNGLNPSPSHPFGAPQFPRFTKCMNSEDDMEQLDWWQREYGCTTLFASISALLVRSTVGPHTTTHQPVTSVEPLSEITHTRKGDQPNRFEPSNKQGENNPRRAHRAGGLFAGVGLASDFYSGGFGRYPDVAQPDVFPWRHSSSSDHVSAYMSQQQHDALEDMTSERRKKDVQACIDFRSTAVKVVTWGELEKVCCNVICYCDDIQNSTNLDRCGPLITTSSTQGPRTGKNPPLSSLIDPKNGPESNQTDLPELNITLPGSDKSNGYLSNSTISSSPSTTPTTTTGQVTSGNSRRTYMITDSTAVTATHTSTDFAVTDTVSSPLRKGEGSQGSVAAPVMASEKAQRPIWTPVNGNADLHHSARGHRVGGPEEWGNIVFGDARRIRQ